jgi:hypothetical protein
MRHPVGVWNDWIHQRNESAVATLLSIIVAEITERLDCALIQSEQVTSKMTSFFDNLALAWSLLT